MKIRVLFFSVLRDVTQVDETVVEVAPGAAVVGLLEILYEKWPGLKSWDASLLVAMDQEYVKRNTTLHENAEVAVMPPVQGG